MPLRQESTDRITDESEQVVDFLSSGEAYPEQPNNVQRLETHISWVFLTDANAYKLKKRVKFDFLDFTLEENRRLACDEEIRVCTTCPYRPIEAPANASRTLQ